MEKTMLTPAVALKEVNNGKRIYYDTKDGYCTIRRKSKTIYEIVVYEENKKPVTFNGNVQNAIKTFNSKMVEGLYIKEI